jgi:D-alanyl-D-alanine carboxypeptidase
VIDPPAATALLDRTLGELAARRDVPHIVMGVEQVEGGFRWAGAAGRASPDGRVMTTGTPYFIASIDKLMNAALMMRLVERGEVRLEAPAADYLPASQVEGLHRRHGVDRTGAITIEHLLAHASGLPDWLEDRPRGGRSLVDRLEAEGDFAMTREELAAYVRDRLTPHFPPQDLRASRVRVRYSDTNFMLLTGVIEQVTGGPLHEVHRTDVYEPLGMTRTWTAGGPSPPGVVPASLWFGARAVEIPGMMRSFAGVYSTVADQIGFLRAFVQGGLFAQPGTGARMQRPWRRFGFPLDAAALRAPNWPIEYGLGLMRFAVPRWLPPFRGSPALVGHTGSTGTWLFHCPERELLLAGAVDQVTAGPLPFRTLPGLVQALRPPSGQ